MSVRPFKTIKAPELPNLLGDTAIAIDVRDTDYDQGGHLLGSINIPIGAIIDPTSKSLESLQRYQTIACYCMLSKQRALTAAAHLAKVFPEKTIYLVEGGYNAILETFHGTERIVAPKQN